TVKRSNTRCVKQDQKLASHLYYTSAQTDDAPSTSRFRPLGQTKCYSPTPSWRQRHSRNACRSICNMTQGSRHCPGRGASRFPSLRLRCTASFERSDQHCATKCSGGSTRRKCTPPANALSGRSGTASFFQLCGGTAVTVLW